MALLRRVPAGGVAFRSLSVSPALAQQRVKPIQSVTEDEARLRVKRVYKEWCRFIPEFCHHFHDQLQSLHPPIIRDGVKAKFIANKDVRDLRAIDILAHRAEIELRNTKESWNQSPQLLSSLFAESVNPKPKDFMSKFLAGKD